MTEEETATGEDEFRIVIPRSARPWKITALRPDDLPGGIRFGKALSVSEYTCARFRLQQSGAVEARDYQVHSRIDGEWFAMLTTDQTWAPAEKKKTARRVRRRVKPKPKPKKKKRSKARERK